MKRLAIATGVAVVVAAIVLVTTVLPAEYGIDLVGTGERFGLLELYEAGNAAESYPVAPEVELDESQTAERPRIYKVDSAEWTLKPGQSFEYKYELEKGAGMVYAWKSTGRVKYEFHGDPQDRTLRVQSYEKQESDFGSGSLEAPFTGIHGWYWENASAGEVTVSITSSGFYKRAVELRPRYDDERHRTVLDRIPHDLADAAK
jgi:hypothetical protein